jgi:hypothetical protein
MFAAFGIAYGPFKDAEKLGNVLKSSNALAMRMTGPA